MKRIFENIILVCTALLMVGCINPDLEIQEPVHSGEGLISLNLLDSSYPSTKAPATKDEKAVSHIDLILFRNTVDGDKDKPGDKESHVRIDATNIQAGEMISLGKKDSYTKNEKFWVYVIANSNLEESEFAGVEDFQGFCQLAESDERMFLTADTTSYGSAVTIPRYFLMDGLAYDSYDKSTKENAVVFNNGDNSKDLLLEVDLKRAAAKIVVNISAKGDDGSYGDFVTFIQDMEDGTAKPDDRHDLNLDGFYLRNLPYSSLLISDQRAVEAGYGNENAAGEVRYRPLTRTTRKYNGYRFDNSSTAGNIFITAYAYARDWRSEEVIERTFIIANIPLIYTEYATEDATGAAIPQEEWDTDTDNDGNFDAKKIIDTLYRNYYQIPVSESMMFKRNTYYQVNIDINIPGGEDPGTPVTLKPIGYEVYDWTEHRINVGGATDRTAYLMVNRDTLEMANEAVDSISLEFASSKAVEVDIVNYWYIDKDGEKVARYDEDGDVIRENASKFEGGALLGSRVQTTYVPVDLNGKTYAEAVSLIDDMESDYSYNNNNTDDEAILVQLAARFVGSYTANWTTYEEGGETIWNVPEDERLSDDEIINELQQTYGLSETEARNVFEGANLTEGSYYYWGTRYYYFGPITVPRQKVDHTETIDLNRKTYTQAKEALQSVGLSDTEIENLLEDMSVTGTVQVPSSQLVNINSNPVVITAVPDPGMSGRIIVKSTIPENNTVRYIELLVRNDYLNTPENKDDDLKERVIIKQSSLLNISNIISWYSYRDDFIGEGQTAPTTYKNYSRNNRVTGIRYYTNGNYYAYYPTGTNTNENSTTGSLFFRSKVFEDPSLTGDAMLSYYTVTEGGDIDIDDYGSENPRMYHVRITASSEEYTLGAPRMTPDGYTDPEADNAKMVSPSFMIASRLGFLTSNYMPDMYNVSIAMPLAREHCKQYAEVYEERDENGEKTGKKYVLDDWRLPTTEELKIIINLQGTSGQDADAIDYLLNGRYYYSASGQVRNIKSTTNGTTIRCIRDAFDSKK